MAGSHWLAAVPITPPEIAAVSDDEGLFVSENLLALQNTRIGNLMGLCALTLPTGTPSAGLSLLGQPFGEERLLRLGQAAERVVAGG